MFDFVSRWKQAGRARMQLDSLLSYASPDASLEERLEWLVELFRWTRSQGNVTLEQSELQTGQLQATRIRYLLIQLHKDKDRQLKVAQTLRSILYDTSALDLFCTTGLPTEAGFFSELLSRVTDKFLPRPPHEGELGEVFVRVFSSQNDIHWLERLEGSMLSEIWALFHHGSTLEDDKVWRKLNAEVEDAILFLAGQIRAFGLDPKIRMRMSKMPLRERPFFRITAASSQILKKLRVENIDVDPATLKTFQDIIAECRTELKVAYNHLDVYGVSVSIVYQLDRIDSLLNRMETLFSILLGERNDPPKMIMFVSLLITELRERESFRSFFSENLSLLSMKIAEQSAETGEHYITRDSSEYKKMFRSAGGGGVIAAFIGFTKIFIEEAPLSYFVLGIFKSVNYSVGFVWMQVAGFTLATRQPAMTANALAAQMYHLDDKEARTTLVDEIVNLIRSQGAAIFGNVAFVIPTAFVVSTVIFYLKGSPLLTDVEAIETLKHYSALGMTPFHAAFTGLLLWAASVIAGWITNWSIYREIPQALASHRGLKAIFGPSRLNRIVGLYQKNLSGWTGYIALGFLLGMTPKILGFIGLPLDIRHVTISSGTITYAVSSLGWNFVYLSEFWLAFIGIGIIGIMNVGVSFFMALLVALKARRIDPSLRTEVYAEVLRRFKSAPLSFVMPPREAKS